MFTGTYPIGTAFHSFKKAQFQLQNPDPDPDWRFESRSTRIQIRIQNTGYYIIFLPGSHFLSKVHVCVEVTYTVGKIDTWTKHFFLGTCKAKIEIRILAL